MTSTERRLSAAGLLAAAVLQLALVLVPGPPLHTRVVEAIPDGVEYEELAGNLARLRTFTRDTAPPFRAELFRTPGYPLVLAPLYAALRDPLPALLALQLLVSLGLVLLVRRLVLELGLGPVAAGTAALLTGLSPNLAFLATKAVTETVFTLGLVVCLVLLNRFRLGRRSSDLVGASLAGGLLILIRPAALLFPLAVSALVLGWWLRGPRFRLVAVLLPLAGAAVVVTPWVVRNGRATGHYLVSTAGEHNLYLYNAAAVLSIEDRTDLASARDRMRAEATREFGTLDTNDEGAFWSRAGVVARRHLLRRPVSAAAVQAAGMVACFTSPVSLNPLLVHSGVPEPADPHVFQRATALALRGRLGAAAGLVWTRRLRLLGPFAWAVLIAAALFLLLLDFLGVVGLFSPGSKGTRWLLMPLVYFTLLPGPVAEARFRAPVEPVMAVFAAAGAIALSGSRRRAGRDRGGARG